MPNIIQWFPDSEKAAELAPSPKTANKYIPKWYQSSSPYHGKKTFDPNTTNATYKKCPPVLDALLSGYIQELWCDIHVRQTDMGPEITWGIPLAPVEMRSSEQMLGFPVPAGHHPQPFVWMNPWGFKVPRGWSLLITHPLNRDDLPFRTLSAVVDADKFHLSGKIAFWLKDGFEGTIPMGTPLFQIIPIKRASWISRIRNYDRKREERRSFNLRRIIFDSYKKQYWSKKEYK